MDTHLTTGVTADVVDEGLMAMEGPEEVIVVVVSRRLKKNAHCH